MQLPPDFWPLYIWIPLGVNLLTTVIGIIVTVFWIDKLIKRREEEQEENLWKPAKGQVYSKLMFINGNIVSIVYPPGSKKETRLVYRFGNSCSFPMHVIDESITVSMVFELIKSNPQEANDGTIRMLSDVSNDLEEVVLKYSHLMEPELLPIVIDLAEFVSAATRVHTVFYPAKMLKDKIILDLSSVASTSRKLNKYLLDKADEVIDRDEFLKQGLAAYKKKETRSISKLFLRH